MPLNKLVSDLKNYRSTVLNFIQSDEILTQITDLKRDELFKGKRGDNSDITPKYQEVPGFKWWYLEWKKENIPTYKLDGTPDLFIDGTFHSSLFTIYVSPGIYKTDSNYSLDFMAEVVQMHDNGTLLDLTPDNRELIADEIEKFMLSNFNV